VPYNRYNEKSIIGIFKCCKCYTELYFFEYMRWMQTYRCTDVENIVISIIADIYSGQLQRVQDELLKKPFSIEKIMFLQDKARLHTAKITRNKLNSFGWEIFSHFFYSPDTSPSDYLFLSLNDMLDWQFKTWEELEKDFLESLKSRSTVNVRILIIYSYYILQHVRVCINTQHSYHFRTYTRAHMHARRMWF